MFILNNFKIRYGVTMARGNNDSVKYGINIYFKKFYKKINKILILWCLDLIVYNK